ncbi:MAG: PE-PPE domain-containing protein [Mycobacterium sp.]|nr:MAG: PE-PPE domain-containing protein [Mycobacterium sp.]
MTYVLTHPQLLATAAMDVTSIQTSLNAATAAAVPATTDLAAMAADEVSEAVASLFNAFARQGQAAMAQVAAFPGDLTRALAAAAYSYESAEAANLSGLAAPLTGGTTALTQAVAAGPYVTLVMGGSGTPIPPADFVANVVSRYVTPNLPAGLVQALYLPAGEYPDSGIKDLTSDVSIARGVEILTTTIQQQLAAGNTVNVVGYSQSANIAALAMQQLNPTGTPSSLPINFVLLGNSMNPNGGWDARFPGLSFPSLGFTALGAAPSNSFPTTSYTIEYDGWADFPRYPINILSDLNALFGMVTVHGGYDTLTAAQLDSAILLPTQGPTTSTYYMIPTQDLPLLEPLRFIPYVGDPAADVLQPILRPVINWGYGDPNYGWSTGPANVPTPFGFLPPPEATIALGPALLNGFQQGILAGTTHLSTMTPPTFPPLPSLSDAVTSMSAGPGTFTLPSVTDLLRNIQAGNTQLVGSSTMALSTAYSTLLPTADIATAALISLPSYDYNLFLDGMIQMFNGQPVEGLMSAIGNPIAANMGLLPFLLGLELASVALAGDSILTGTPFPST